MVKYLHKRPYGHDGSTVKCVSDGEVKGRSDWKIRQVYNSLENMIPPSSLNECSLSLKHTRIPLKIH